MQILSDPQMWLGLAQIALINIVLSIDNAIVIALVARSLPAHRQMQAVVCGTVVVIVRIGLTLIVAALLITGLALSIPLVIVSATLLIELMQKLPLIITFGAGVLGRVAGEMLITDPVWAAWIKNEVPWAHLRILGWEVSWAHVMGAMLVVAVGSFRSRRSAARSANRT